MLEVRYFAGARAAAGLSAEHIAASSLDDLTVLLGERHGERLALVVDLAGLAGVEAHVLKHGDVAWGKRRNGSRCGFTHEIVGQRDGLTKQLGEPRCRGRE